MWLCVCVGRGHSGLSIEARCKTEEHSTNRRSVQTKLYSFTATASKSKVSYYCKCLIAIDPTNGFVPRKNPPLLWIKKIPRYTINLMCFNKS